MTQYTHNYVRAQLCNNMTDSNGIEYWGNCQHRKHYQGPHCERCGLEESASTHQQPQAQV